MTDVSTGVTRTVTSNEDGYYTAAFLPPGTYRVTVRLVGFVPITRDDVTLPVDQVVRLDFVLELEGIREAVRVEATAPLLEREISSVGHVIDHITTVTLPLNGRRYSELAALTPGVVPNPTSRAADGFNLNGNRSFQNTFLIDGLDNNSYIPNAPTGSTQVMHPSLDTIQEFKVESANYSAEYGRAAGGVISVATKSGTNALHGSGVEFFRHDALAATEFFAKRAGLTPPLLRYHQFGGTLGGPLIRSRIFFFGSYQGTRDRRTDTATVTVPSSDMVRGQFGSVAIYDPLNVVNGLRQPFPNNTIPPERLDPVGQRIAALYPTPNRTGTVNNFVGPVSRHENRDQQDLRLDHHLSDAAHVFVRYSRSSERSGKAVCLVHRGTATPPLRHCLRCNNPR
jgi:hypothetical protein